MIQEREFFKGKRPWSKIKDKVIGDYLVPYLNKVSKLPYKIVMVDAFAGRGIFEEDGSKGSPLIICETAEKYVPDQYLGVFVNKNKASHQKLDVALEGYIKKRKALPILGSAQDLLKELSEIIGDATILIYLDPFGLKGCEFELLEPYLRRDKRFSTEVIINISMPTLHRLSTFKAVKERRITDTTKKLNQRLSKILGGDYWQKIMWSDSLPAQKEQQVVEKYVGLLKKYLPYAGFCPVRERQGGRVKYYIIFCSRHEDALLLMNDIMCKAYFKTIHEIELKGTLFEGMMDWKETQQRGDVKEEICRRIRRRPGITRKDLWIEIIKEHFMKWIKSEFRESIKAMVGKQIRFVSSTSRLNDNSKLYLLDNPGSSVLNTLPKPRISVPRVHYDRYFLLTGQRNKLVKKVNDGSIITRFDKTPLPETEKSVVCPHFLELKWAYGCPYDCAWCYLKGTFRFQPKKTAPVVKPYEKIEQHTRRFLEEVKTPEILNAGEIADSLMHENAKLAFSKFIIPMFEEQKLHKVLLLTKSSSVENLLEIEPHKQVIMSFSLNAIPVAKRWEKAPGVIKRIEAAKKVLDAGYEIRIRIDPMVPIGNWEKHYLELLEIVFNEFTPDRITLGSLRGLQTTINGCSDRSWVKYLKESSNWGKKIDFETREALYSTMIERLNSKYEFSDVALCKETVEMWSRLGLDYKKIRCNCVW
jgi:spore photoproduct lyase